MANSPDSFAVLLAKSGRAVVLLALLVLASACVPTMYVDNGLPDVQPADKVQVAQPKPVQLLFEFRTKGTINGRATDMLKAQATEIVRDSGLFSEVSTTPNADGSLLSVVVDNVPITSQSDAAAKGFATGLTFGLVGSTVSDGYICAASYVPATGSAPIQKEVHHALHSTLGAKSAPPNATKAKGMEEAVRTMLRQSMSNALQEVAKDPGFPK